MSRFNSHTGIAALGARGGHATVRLQQPLGYPSLVKARAAKAQRYAERKAARLALEAKLLWASEFLTTGCPNCGYKPRNPA